MGVKLTRKPKHLHDEFVRPEGFVYANLVAHTEAEAIFHRCRCGKGPITVCQGYWVDWSYRRNWMDRLYEKEVGQ